MYRAHYTVLICLGLFVALIKGSIRLMDGINEFQGRLEVYEEGSWGTVCNNGWNRHAGNVAVVCRQLGFATGRYFSKYKRNKKTFRIDNVICDGSEGRIGACQYDVLESTNCAGRDDYEVNIICERPTYIAKPNSGDIRLMNGKDAFEGRVEIYLESNWLSVCQNGWRAVDARVACKQLGYNGGIARNNAFFGQGYDGALWRVALNCDNTEDRLIDCKRLAAVCSRRNIAGVICEAPVPYEASCEPDEQCEGNSTCVLSKGRQLCQCLDETTMFWDSAVSACKIKSSFNESCQPANSRQCSNTLICNTHGDTSTCLCLNDMFWDDRQGKCKERSLHNESCFEDIPDSCASNLVCTPQNNNGTCQCENEESLFWDHSMSSCQTKISYNDMCSASGDCQSNLLCRKEFGMNRCLCPEQVYPVWHVDDNRCFAVDQLNAVYIKLQLTYNDALTYCVNEINGSLATWSNSQMLFENCTDSIADIWSQTTPVHQKEMPHSNSTCQLARGNHLYNTSCTDTINFVCIYKRHGTDEEYCKDFPSQTVFSKSLTISRSAVIWTIVVIAAILLSTGITISAVIYRRKRKWEANNNSSNSGLQTFLNNAYDTNMPFIENPYMEIRPINEPDYANVISKCGAIEETQVKINQGNSKCGAIEETQVKINQGNKYTKVKSTSTGYIDMTGKLTSPSSNTTDDGCSQHTCTATPSGHYIRCKPSTSKEEARDGGYTLCSRPEAPPGVYNTFADMKKASVDHINENPYDDTHTMRNNGYDVFNGQKGAALNETHDDISENINSPGFPV
ncbi:uncharacterized protein LOC117321735 isoform X2 [Pecten maximus]|uniref:uncharacterized protein LOC117321735 isoform X2 n=1 Tax=Pecten maximus TaxID=6579 RepID=UPI001457F182|nr:uncharacterized protein LOC117321735 isoform X2 [Pecten maximus]